MEWQGAGVLVLGAGCSGIAAARVLRERGARVVLSDAKPEAACAADLTPLKALGVRLAFGPQTPELLAGVGQVVVSPGIPMTIPLIKAARERDIEVMSEVEVAYRLCRAPLIAITGTNGKTTTTTLLGEMLRAARLETATGGNIGRALSEEVLRVGAAGAVVAEVSSFQLEGIIDFRPHVAVVLNVTPDHLERHGTLEEYQRVKERIFANQTANDYLLLNYDDPIVRGMKARSAAAVLFFSRTEALTEGIYVKDGRITISRRGRAVSVCPTAEIRIKGNHNVENALAACGAAYLAGVRPDTMAAALKSFPGVEHRIEPVRAIDGVPYYNDSKATNPDSAIKALESFEHIILIAGGYDKGGDLTPFMREVKRRCDHLILLGAAAERFRAAARAAGAAHIHMAGSLAEAVALARALAAAPQVVLLSPACSSYDMFNNYEERGRIFKDLVRNLA